MQTQVHASSKVPYDSLTQSPERFIDLCEVTADLTEVKSSIKPQYNSSNGTKFYTLQFDVVLLFGLTELQAQIAWIEDVRLSFSPDETRLWPSATTGSRKTVRYRVRLQAKRLSDFSEDLHPPFMTQTRFLIFLDKLYDISATIADLDLQTGH